MEFKVDSKPKLKVTIYGTSYELRTMSVQEIENYLELAESGDKKSGYLAAQKVLSDLGLPMEVIKGMDAEHFNQLLEYVMGGSKKK